MKGKKIISAIFSVSLIASMSIPTLAAVKTLSENMKLEDLQEFAQKSTYSYKIYEYESENAEINAESKEYELEYYKQLLKSTPKSDSKYTEYMFKVAELEKESALAEMDWKYFDDEKEKADKKMLDLTLKSKYYELCTLENQAESQRANVQYMKKYVEIESVKLENGQTTETDKRLAVINLEMAEKELSAAENAVQSKTREISDFLNQYKNAANFSVQCNLPKDIAYKQFNSEKLYKKFSENCFELKKQRKNMEFDEDYLDIVEEFYGKKSDTYKSSSNSYEIDKLNVEIKENSYKSQITEMVSSYDQAFAEYLSCTMYKSVLEEKLDILKTAFDTGNMSELDYLKQYAELSTEIYKADSALVQADILYDKLCLVEEGILISLD